MLRHFLIDGEGPAGRGRERPVRMPDFHCLCHLICEPQDRAVRKRRLHEATLAQPERTFAGRQP